MTAQRWLPLVVCSLATFLLLLHGTVVTVGVTAIGRDLHTGFAVSQWVIDGYLLALGALLLAAGSWGDRSGHRRVFGLGAAVFCLGTLVAGLAPNGATLVAARGVQGVGGAALLATAVPLLALTYDGRRRAIAFAVWSTCAGAGSTVGTIAGGVVTELVGWRWLFLGTLPLGVLVLVLGAGFLPADRPRSGGADIWGTVVVTLGVTAVTYSAIDAGERGWTSWPAGAALLVAVVSVPGLVAVERHVRCPMLPPGLFATRGFAGVLVCAFAYYFATFAALPAISAWLQSTVGLSAVGAALLLAVQLVAYICVAIPAGSRIRDHDRALRNGTLLSGLGCVAGAVALWSNGDRPGLVAALILTGVGAAIVSPVLPIRAATAVPPEHTGTAGAVANSVRQFGLVVGVAVCGAIAHQGAGSSGATHALGTALGVAAVVGVGGAVIARGLMRADSSGLRAAAPRS